MWQALKTTVSNIVKSNASQLITGSNMQQVLYAIIDSLGAISSYRGFAKPSTNPGIPSGPAFYIATEQGIYSNFNNAVVQANGLYLYTWNGNNWVFSEGLKGIQRVYHGTTMPVDATNGDVWIYTGEPLTRYNRIDGAWVDLSVNASNVGALDLSELSLNSGGQIIFNIIGG